MSTQRPPLSRDRIIEAALHLVDAQGLRRLTMRRLGDALEVEAMAIYHHLPLGKEQLLDALISHVAEVPARLPTERPVGAALRERLSEWANTYRTRLITHSGVMPLLLTRRNSTALARTAASVRELLSSGGQQDTVATTGTHALVSYVIGHCAMEIRDSHTATADPADAIDWNARFRSGLELLLATITPK